MVKIGEYEVQIDYKNVKNLRLRIRAETGTIVVSAPTRAKQSAVENFVRTNTAWIEQQLEKIARRPNIPRVTNERLLLEAQSLTEYWQQKIGVETNRVRLRRMKTRWGVCNISTRIITINSELTKYPEQCLEYVVVHELAHLKIAAHNKEFWAIVENALPDYKLWRKTLK
jgi:predicted metal-dependent hydrolase